MQRSAGEVDELDAGSVESFAVDQTTRTIHVLTCTHSLSLEWPGYLDERDVPKIGSSAFVYSGRFVTFFMQGDEPRSFTVRKHCELVEPVVTSRRALLGGALRFGTSVVVSVFFALTLLRFLFAVVPAVWRGTPLTLLTDEVLGFALGLLLMTFWWLTLRRFARKRLLGVQRRVT